jgi:hypothetical protein
VQCPDDDVIAVTAEREVLPGIVDGFIGGRIDIIVAFVATSVSSPAPPMSVSSPSKPFRRSLPAPPSI